MKTSLPIKSFKFDKETSTFKSGKFELEKVSSCSMSLKAVFRWIFSICCFRLRTPDSRQYLLMMWLRTGSFSSMFFGVRPVSSRDFGSGERGDGILDIIRDVLEPKKVIYF